MKGAARSRSAWSPQRDYYLAHAELRAPDIPLSDRDRAGAFEEEPSSISPVQSDWEAAF
jgi:hypothetical protein